MNARTNSKLNHTSSTASDTLAELAPTLTASIHTGPKRRLTTSANESRRLLPILRAKAKAKTKVMVNVKEHMAEAAKANNKKGNDKEQCKGNDTVEKVVP